MEISFRSHALSLPAFSANGPGILEVRNSQGVLDVFIAFLPTNDVFFMSTRGNPDFERDALELGLKLQVVPKQNQ